MEAGITALEGGLLSDQQCVVAMMGLQSLSVFVCGGLYESDMGGFTLRSCVVNVVASNPLFVSQNVA
jgi:hypothetical protein